GGGDGETSGGTHTETLPPGPQATDVCLGERGFSLRPATSGVSAISPSGAEFTIVFFDSEAEASEAAGGAEGSTAVANAVVTPKGKRLTSQELATVDDCVRG
ncbi:MAG TPA: hypothetical protein VFV62_02435, partial [Gaiellaceae bacterium]|nr:hypothetical protein [Gaiellaceae bacterium]